MGVLIGILIAWCWIIGFTLSRLFTVLVHELGHAIPCLLFSDQIVEIHIGSFGDAQNSTRWKFGRFHTFFKSDLLHWNIGLCKLQGQPQLNLKQRLIVVFGGPAMSLFFGIILLFILLKYSWSSTLIFIFSFLIMSFLYDFLVNLIPIKFPIELHDGTKTYNDGMKILQLLQQIKYPISFQEGRQFFIDKKYTEATDSFKKALAEKDKKDIRIGLIHSLVAEKNFEETFEQIEILKEKKEFQFDDLELLGHAYLQKQDYSNAVKTYNQFLFKKFDNANVLNNRGFCFIQLAEYEKALQDFNSAIVYDPKHAFAHNNCGLAKIRLGDLEGGFTDIKKSKSLDDTNPFIYLYLGYYYKEKNQINLALENFKKAKDMKIDFHGIDYLIDTSEEFDFE